MGTQQRANFMAQATKEILNKSSGSMSNYGSKLNKNSFLFSFDNKENNQSHNAQRDNDNSISYHEFSPSRILTKSGNQIGHQKVNNFLDSDSSGGEEDNKQQLAHKLEKQYFLDKSTLLKHLSPDRNKHSSKTRHAKNSDSSLSGFASAGGVGAFHHYNKSSAPTNIGGLLNSSGIGHQVLSDRDNKSFNGNGMGPNAFSNGSTIIQSS